MQYDSLGETMRQKQTMAMEMTRKWIRLRSLCARVCAYARRYVVSKCL